MRLNSSFYGFLFLLMSASFLMNAQEQIQKKDTAKVYRNIENYSKKSKFTQFVHKLIFEPVVKDKPKKTKVQKSKKVNYASYECKVIRKIHIITLDPFGFSETDSLKKPKRKTDRLGNALHYKTRQFAINNLLLYKENELLDSLMVKESERIIRSQRYIRGVATQFEKVSNDSVDVYLRVLDAWSLYPDFSTSTTISTFRVSERNFMGIGHELTGTYRESLVGKDHSYSTGYTIPTLFKTFIRTNLNYQKDIDGSYGKYINIERPFFSSYVHWAGGIYNDEQYKKIVLKDTANVSSLQSYKYNSHDYWLGYSFPFLNGKSEYDRTTNFFINARFLQIDYEETPNPIFDPYFDYSNENNYLFSLGASSRKFIQDKYLFNFNVVEDIASGFIYSITAGNQYKNSTDRFYLGGRIALGRFYKFGYLSSNLEAGTFFRNNHTEQTTINWSSVYFTNLIETGNWKFRQFIKPQLVYGINRLPSTNDRLNLNGDSGLPGFESTLLTGRKKIVLSLQTQSYSPWNLLGFRLNPYLSYSLGMLSDQNDTFKGSKAYSQVGVGVILSNDFMVFNSFQISFSYFPSVPDDGQVFKTNSIRSYDLTLPNFEIPKPSVVSYR